MVSSRGLCSKCGFYLSGLLTLCRTWSIRAVSLVCIACAPYGAGELVDGGESGLHILPLVQLKVFSQELFRAYPAWLKPFWHPSAFVISSQWWSPQSRGALGPAESEIVQVELIKSYCLPISFYSLGALEMNASLNQELSVCWNNGFRKFFRLHRW